MPIQQLKHNPGFRPDFWKPPPIIEPPPDVLGATKDKLCTSCQDLFLTARPRWTDSSSALLKAVSGELDAINMPEDVGGSTSSKKLAALKCFNNQSVRDLCLNAGRAKCHLCVMVCAKIVRDTNFGSTMMTLLQKVVAGLPMDEYLIKMAPLGWHRSFVTLFVLVTTPGDDFVTNSSLSVSADVKADTRVVGLMSYAESTSSDLSIRQCQEWLKVCQDNHTRCISNTSSQTVLPTRLLDLRGSESSDKITLHHTSVTFGPYEYVTLSHCWGQYEKLELTKGTLPDLITGIPISRLAPTFREAINITLRLGLRFLWIDCLCIIQNSPKDEDWLREASKMADIYGGATCNIAAGASSDSGGGCFRQRPLIGLSPLRFERHPFPLYQGEDTAGPVFITMDMLDHDIKLLEGPLDKRGWILQELILAPRTLHFSKDQIFWECRQSISSESWPGGMPSGGFEFNSLAQRKALLDQTELQLYEDSKGFVVGERDLLYHRWTSIVELYTKRLLTRSSDKLPALSGVANIIKALIQDEYLAGLWRQTVLQDLAWMVRPEGRNKSWPSEYRAPSWTWASVDGPVTWDTTSKHEDDMQAQIHEVEVTPFDQTAPTGRVTNGFLDIAGLIRQVTWVNDPNHASNILLVDTASAGWLDKEIRLHPDVERSNLSQTIFLFQLYRSFDLSKHGSPLGRRRLHGLILMPIDQKNSVYKRVGYFLAANWGYTKIADEGWDHFTDGWAKERVTIK